MAFSAVATADGKHEFELDCILKEVVPANHMTRPTSLVSVKESDEDGNASVVLISEQHVPKSETLFLCSRSFWPLIRAVVQLMSVDGLSKFGNCHARMEPFQNTSVLVMRLHLQSLHQRYSLMWFWLPSKYSRLFQWLVANNFNLNSSSILGIISDNSEDECSWKRALSKHDNKSTINAILLYGQGPDAVATLDLFSKHIRQLSSHGFVNYNAEKLSLVASESKISSGRCSTPQQVDGIEVTDIDLSAIKGELKTERSETEASCKDADCSISNAVIKTQRGLVSLVSISKKYYGLVKRRKCELIGSEPMLILQCPGCTAEFRGLSDRLCRLIAHIQTHEPKFRKQYMNVISKRYSPLIHEMYKRMKVSN